MTDEEIRATLGPLLRTAGVTGGRAVATAVRLRGGSNNRVYLVTAGSEQLVLKAYFRDDRPRLQAEFSFLKLARECGVESVAAPLARDDDRAMALYEFLPGRPMSAREVRASAVADAASLVATINRQRDEAKGAEIPTAAEGCFSIAEHLDRVESRVQALAGIRSADAVDELAVGFVSDRLRPAWRELRQRVLQNAGKQRVEPAASIPAGQRCVSPSDFGFHNALIDEAGRVRFLDFEYAGWDDPAKLVCDFFCQVAVPVPLEYQERFEELVLAPFHESHQIAARIALLRPVYRIKWACIVLNDFLADGRARRSYALGADQDRERRVAQLDKATAILEGAA